VKGVVIFGLGDFARAACVYLEADSPRRVAAFTVDREYLDAPELLGKPVVPFEDLPRTHPPGTFDMLVGMGYGRVNESRAEKYRECKELGYELISYVSSRALVWPNVEYGDNVFIFEANVIQPFVRIGSDVVIWSGNHIGHDTTIGDHVFIASHAVISGNVSIGDYCFVGVNATFRDGITVGERSVIGAGAVLLEDTERGSVHPATHTAAIAKKSWDLRKI